MFGPHGQGGALESLIHKLQNDCGLTVNRPKCAALGATPTACAHKPDWLLEPTSFKNGEGKVVEAGARGIVICQKPIGEKLFCQAFLQHKFTSISSVIQQRFSALSPKDKHAAFHAFHYSYQARFDYYLSTNPPSLTDPLAKDVDTCLKYMLEEITSSPLFQPAAAGIPPLATLLEERVSLRNRDSGLGFRPIAKRFLFLNSINLPIPCH